MVFATLIISSSLCSFKFFTPFDDSVEPGRSQSSCCGILSIMYKIVHTISLEHILVQIFFFNVTALRLKTELGIF